MANKTHAWIGWVEEEDASGAVAETYKRARNKFSFVPDVVKVFSIRPEVAEAKDHLAEVLLGDASTLGARRADLIGTAISGMNHCEYCGTAHSGLLATRGDMDESEAVQVYRDWRKAELDEQELAMLAFAEKLTFTPAMVEEADIELLRDAGFTDENIFDIVLLSAYRNFMNRVNDGLGVMPDRLAGRFGESLLKAIASDT
ncbi:MAG: peroxidase-related enzyme [Halieaceae bacterium]|nr:peroxidase-related enzyme [Halieaceae bacterium]